MRLTQFTDFSLRVLIYLGLKENDRATVEEVSSAFKVSKNHMEKVVHHLAQLELIVSKKGRNGGISLEPAIRDVKLGDLIKELESDLFLVECFDKKNNSCVIAGHCELTRILDGALSSFLKVLNQYTLSDLMGTDESAKLKKILRIS